MYYCMKEFSIMLRDVKFAQLGSKFIKKITSEVIKEF